MSKSKSFIHRRRLYLFALSMFGVVNIAIAAEQTYVREYIYQASEADSKLTARTIALQEIKRELLSELGTHVTALVKIQSSSDGATLGKEEIETLSAGVTHVEILEEKWNGVVYVLKAQIKADPEDVLESLHKMVDADEKKKQISQKDAELGRLRNENIQFVESLTQSKREIAAALAEIDRLKILLEEQQTEASRQALQTAYQQQVDRLSSSEIFDSAFKHYSEGNYLAAYGLFKKAAVQGFAPAQNNLGVLYYNGDGVARDAKQAAHWWQKAAEQGNAQAQNNVGVMYVKGDVIARDAKQAVYWYQKAAEQGLAEAQYNLGLKYVKGQGVTRDAQQAVYWWQKAAEQGMDQAQSNLGWMYANGEGVTRDVKQAVYWYQKAVEQGLAQAQNNLGVMYASGEGVARDAKLAVYWLRKAAEQGNAQGQYNLGVMYDKGEGVARDAKLAVYWYQKAAQQGNENARTALTHQGISD